MSKTREIHILDTSVLLSVGSRALFASPNTEIIIPFAVINELENKRTDQLLGYSARTVIREIEQLRETHGRKLLLDKGVLIDKKNDIYLKIEGNHISTRVLPEAVQNRSSTDMRILAVAMNLSSEKENLDAKITLITNDLPLRLTAQLIGGVNVSKLHLPKLWQGNFDGVVTDNTLTSETISALFEGKSNLNKKDFTLSEVHERAKNLSFVLAQGSTSCLARVVPRTGQIIPLKMQSRNIDIKTRGAGQKIAMDYLLDPDIEVVSLGGRAGTGKTMLSVAAGLAQLRSNKRNQDGVTGFDQVRVFRSLYAVGNQNLGYLPGTEEEKMSPWAGAVDDVLEAIYQDNEAMKERIKHNEELVVNPITHIRGRTFTNTLVIIDEAQNYDISTLLNIISRLGKGSKVVLCWDAAQSDNLSVSAEDGVMTLVDKYLSYENFAHVTLTESQRSRVAEQASIMLEEVSAL